LRPAPARRRAEPTIALINVVFLMLIFFLVAGTVAPPLDKGLKLVRTEGLEGAEPPDALVLSADGTLGFRGAPVNAADWLAGQDAPARERVRLVPDRDVPAARLVAVAAELRAAGAGRVVLVTERGLE